ncbi:MAG: hypothetical protein NTW86_14445 [Candidatus Sumerlaeota bacterium]|nr:hypothetical protein [Candidatus Sumerlaeota bacterium]
MHPRERFLCALTGGKPDRVPLELAGFQFLEREPLERIADPLRRRVAERLYGQTHALVDTPSLINRLLVTPPQRIRHERRTLPNGNVRTTSVIDTPRGTLTHILESNKDAGTTWTVKYPVETREDIEKIASVPWEMPAGLKHPDSDALPETFPLCGLLSTRVSSPFVCVAGMMKFELFLELCATELDWMRELTAICEARVMACVKFLLSRPGIEYVWLGGSEWITPPMASPAIYEALVQEQERRIIDYIHKTSTALVHVHCHGKVRRALPCIIDRGADYTEPVEPPPDGDIPMAAAKRVAAGRITLGGNIECRVLCNEDERAVEAAVRAAFDGGKERFVLRPTEGPSPRMGDREFRNYMRLIDVWEELSPIA